MCDQTEVTYSAGDVVWVKLGPVWWPSQVQDYDRLPEEITHDLRKRPIAVVKFFQEDSYEYVKNLTQIYHYNCRKKEEFIKKGLDMVRSSNTREVPSNMKMFPNDIVMAEHITGGDPNILESEAFAPEEKTNYSDLFGSAKKPGKKGKADALKKEFRRHSESPVGNNRKSVSNLPATVPRPITHPRFITKALEGKSDHEVRIRCQISLPRDDEDENVNDNKKTYDCHLCDFQTTRLNVIVLHNKSHSAGFIEAQRATKAKLKVREKERVSLGPISQSELTPTSVTSRGRVKSVPKKLMDYTDEPPPKMLKEKTYSKQAKEDKPPSESPSKISVEKTPKKEKVDSEKASLKRPLFGKRKSAKEKAEIAAKIKQENDAMKETLLKDWDDDDVNEEEVELERLKQALESTTTSGPEDENDSPPKVKKTDNQEKYAGKSKLTKNDPSNKTVNDDVKAKVFEFDDSEDSLPVNINFRLKNKQEKFTDDKFKKPRPPKPLNKPKSKSLTPPIPPPPLFNETKDEDKDTGDLTEAINALLEETSVPLLPEIPASSVSLNTSISDQKSDISSSTDLVDATESSGDSNTKINLDFLTQESNAFNNDLQMECTSSDNEEVNASDKVDPNNDKDNKICTDQKNMMEVSAIPSAETDSEIISSGDATITSGNIDSRTPLTSITEAFTCEDSTTTEITSTCEGSKIFVGDKEVPQINRVSLDESTKNTVYSTDSAKSCDVISNEKEKLITPIDSNDESCLVNDSSLFGLNSEDLKDTKSKVKYGSELNPEDKASNGSINNVSESTVLDQQPLKQELMTDFVVQGEDKKEPKSTTESAVMREEIVNVSESKSNEKDCVPPFITSEELITQEEVISHAGSNVQIIVPSTQDSNVTTLQSNYQQQVETILVQDQGSIVNQTMSQQSLQDMELDINSMPVIIGGEDFMQQEEPKPQLIPMQPKYSESIVISPKVNVPTTSKPDSVIVHLSEPSPSSSSSQNVKTVSLPNKGGKGGGRGGRTPKATSKTIKLSASALKNLGSLPKGGNQQVLILKTTGSKDSQDKGTLQKTQGPLNLIQHGNKILIVNNPQMTGQNKIKLNPQQQQLLTGGKLAPGTRVFTSKVVATTTPPSNETNKTSTSRSSAKTTQKLVISKGGMLSNVSKSVIINSSTAGKFQQQIISAVPGLKNITTSKGQTIVTHNILNTKGGLILPTSSQSGSSSNKTTTIITSQNLPASKGMILTPIATKGGQIISGNQKLRIVSSKAPLSGTRFVVQSSPKKTSVVDSQQKGQQIKLISGLKGQTSGNTIFIQTSQGLVAKSISSSSVSAATSKTITAALPKTVAGSVTSPIKIRMSASPSKSPIVIQQPQSNMAIQHIVEKPVTAQSSPMVKIQQPAPVKSPAVKIQSVPVTVKSSPTVKKVTAPKVKQSPNIVPKAPRKSTPRAPRGGGRSKAKKSDPLVLSTSSSLPVMTQPALVQTQIPQSSDGLLYLTIDESGNCRQLDSKSLLPLEGNTTDSPRTIYIPANNQPQDVGNVFLTIDDAGNTQLVNIAPPTSSTAYTPEAPAPAQDILAKALANTQVFQQETILPDADVSSALASSVDSGSLATSFVEPQYPPPSLSHSVQETSLTLTQPIMTPLEVPSNVSPNLAQISSLPTNYISSNLLNTKHKINPSMPILTEESLAQTRGEPIFLLDSSNNIIPLTSGSQTSFQLTLDDSIVTMTSGSSGSVLPQTYQVVTSDLLTSQLITQDSLGLPKEEKAQSYEQQEATHNMHFTVMQEATEIPPDVQTSQHSGILREALEAPQSFKSEPFLNSVETTQSENILQSDQTEKMVDETGRLVDYNTGEQSELAGDNPPTSEDSSMVEEHSLKRNLCEEETVTSSSDPDNAKRIRLEER